MDAEQLLFLAGGQDNVFDDDVDEQPIQDLALNVDNVFQADDCDAFNSDAQENRVAMDAEQLLFLAGGQDNVFDDDVDEQPIQDLALNVDNVFQADDCDAFNSDVDKASTAQTMFMANLSSADLVTDEAGPSYNLDILSENVQERLNKGQGMNLRGGNAAGYGGAPNRVGNDNQGQARPGQARTVKCYNCNGTGLTRLDET
nr:integrase, catalytic region, zinc finger, CCHC-type, peptidase aspartic, catalytic [Tanacetum cinerariifolium]